MTSETIRKEIKEIQNKLENKKFHGRGISKAKNELLELEEKLADIEALEEAEEIEDDSDVFGEVVDESEEYVKSVMEEEVKEIEEVVTDDIRPEVAPHEEMKVSPKKREEEDAANNR